MVDPTIAAMVVLCSVCLGFIILTIIAGVFFYLDYRKFKQNAEIVLKQHPSYQQKHQ